MSIRLTTMLSCSLLLAPSCDHKTTPPPEDVTEARTGDATPALEKPIALPVVLEAVPTDDDGPLPEIRFAWGVPPCRVPARQNVTKKGKEATLTFDVVLTAADDGFEVELEHMTFVSFDGKDPSDPALAPIIPLILPLLSAMPTFVVSADGEYQRAEHMEDTVAAMLQLYPAGDERNAFAETMKSPQMLATLEEAASDSWNVWVGAWIGWEATPGQPRTFEGEIELMPGIPVPYTSTAETLGRVKGDPSLLLLQARQLIDGPEATRAMIAMLTGMTGTALPPELTIQQFRRTATITVALDPATARPHRARKEMISEVDTRHELEVRDTTFDWSAATGCGRP